MSRPRVSLTMIVRDEEHHLPACLGPVAGLFDEVVVVDTGSTDRTKEVAAGLGARVVEFPWRDDFAAARNEALAHARGAWAFRLDADDRVEGADVDRLRALLAGLPEANVGYAVRYRHDAAPGGRPLEHAEVRLFRNSPAIRWRYRAHEQILLPVREAGGVILPAGVTVRHLGHTDPARCRWKLERTLGLLLLDHADMPADPFVLHYLGWTTLALGRADEAAGWLRRACDAAPPGLSTRPRSFALLARALRRAGGVGPALAACREGRAAHPRDAELLSLEGWLLLEAGAAAEAEGRFAALLSGGAEADELSFDDGLCGYRARHGLAVAVGPGRAGEQERLWRAAAEERPDFGPAWVGLGGLLIAQARWAELGGVLAGVDAALPGGEEVVVLRAKAAAARGDYRGARRALGRYAARHPGAVLPRVALAQVLLLEGRDRAAAGRAAAEAARLDPGGPEVARLLALLDRWDKAGT